MQFQHDEARVWKPEALGEEVDVALARAGRNEQKLGRNELCWCGSGKKFKHCHGRFSKPRLTLKYPRRDRLPPSRRFAINTTARSRAVQTSSIFKERIHGCWSWSFAHVAPGCRF
jgi:hypothetical protein